MYALLQISPQAISDDDLHDPIDVIAVDASQERLEQYLTTYRERHRVACAELEARLEEYGDDWKVVHSRVYDEVAAKHRLGGTLVPEPEFEVGDNQPVEHRRNHRGRTSSCHSGRGSSGRSDHCTSA
jgi:hypothetical protein